MAEIEVLRSQLATVLSIIDSLEARDQLDELETYVLADQKAHKDVLVSKINTIREQAVGEVVPQ